MKLEPLIKDMFEGKPIWQSLLPWEQIGWHRDAERMDVLRAALTPSGLTFAQSIGEATWVWV